MIQITGIIKEISFQREGSNFIIFTLKPEDKYMKEIPLEAFPELGDKNIKCLGNVEDNGMDLLPGYKVQLKGKFKKSNPNFVNTFSPVMEFSFKEDIDILNGLDSAEGLLSYMVKYIHGVGDVQAHRIIETLGLDNVIEELDSDNAIETLQKVKGIGKKSAIQFKKDWDEQKPQRSAMIKLSSLGLSINKCSLIYKTWGDEYKKILDNDPYRLTTIRGIGFVLADEVAREYLGMSKRDPRRYAAIVENAVKEISDNTGDSLIAEQSIKENIKDFIVNDKDFKTEDIKSIYDIGIDKAVENKKIIRINKNVFVLYKYFFYESSIAQGISELLDYKPNTKIYNKYISQYELDSKNNVDGALNKEQLDGVKSILTKGISVLLGGAGTGKTYTIGKVIDTLNKTNTDYFIITPTNKAANRVQEVNPNAKVSTIHKLLGLIPGQAPVFNSENKLPYSKLLIDESSMIDNEIAYMLFDAIDTTKTTVTFIGDPQQLPPVQVGSFFYDIINSGLLDDNIAYLKVVKRTSKNKYDELKEKYPNIIEINKGIDNIVSNSLRILNKKLPISTNYDCINYFSPDNLSNEDLFNDIRTKVKKIYKTLESQGVDYNRDFQLYIPQYKTDVGINEMNKYISSFVNPNEPIEIKNLATKFKVKDKVVYNNTNKELDLTKGDVGEIVNIYPDTKEIDIYFYTKNDKITLKGEDLSYLSLGYTITIHKAQGTEVKYTAIILVPSFYMSLTNELLYTAYTRAKSKVFLLGSEKSYKVALNTHIKARNTFLFHLLSGTPKDDIYPSISRRFMFITEHELKQIRDILQERTGITDAKIEKITYVRPHSYNYFRYIFAPKSILSSYSIVNNTELTDDILHDLINNDKVYFLRIKKVVSKKEQEKGITYKKELLKDRCLIAEINSFNKDVKIINEKD